MVQISVGFGDNLMIMPSSTHFICIYKNVILHNLGSIVIAINTTDWANLIVATSPLHLYTLYSQSI